MDRQRQRRSRKIVLPGRSASAGLYVFEGPDGVGKSTLAKACLRSLLGAGQRAKYFPFPGNGPGTLGKLIYDLHHDRTRFGIKSIDQTSLQTLHLAAHVDAIESKIRPQLEKGVTIILDRYWWSTLVYGKVLGANEASLSMLVELELNHWKTIKPTAVFLISRKNPFGKSKNKVWKRLEIEYARIASEEQRNYPVHTITNQTSVRDARQAILECIARF